MDHNVIIAAAVGFFIGAVLVWIIKNTNQNNAEHLQEESETLRQEYEALKKTFADYRNNVSNHFAKTADAVDQLTDSYKNVYNHLSAGARALMDKESLQKQIEKRQGKSVTLAYLAQNQENDKAAPIDTPQADPPAKPAAAEPAKTAAPAKSAPAETDKNESPQEAVKRHLHNTQGKTP
ncbi:MAG: YhcB family protein [Cardiobacterium hominis]